MGVITKPEILRRITDNQLIKSPNVDVTGNIIIEGSSYDLCVGSIIWKDSETKDTKSLHYNSTLPLDQQEQTTLHPGQMLLVVTKEEINMPLDLSATVFSRNQLARDGILALNAGHVDPGYEGSIIIRLINLRAIPYTLRLGVPIYTIVFQKLDQSISPTLKHPAVSRNDSITKATNSVNEALANALYDLALLNAFIKKEELNDLISAWLSNWFKSWALKVLSWLIAIIIFIVTVASGLQPLMDFIHKHFPTKP